MAKNSSIVLDIGAKIDKTWTTALNNIGTDLQKVGRAVHNNMRDFNKASASIEAYGTTADKASKKLEQFKTRLEELDKIEASTKTSSPDTSILTDRDKRGILRRAKTSDFSNAEDILKAEADLKRARTTAANASKELQKAEGRLSEFKKGQKRIVEARNAVKSLENKVSDANKKVIELEEHLRSLKTFENIKQDSLLITGKILDETEIERDSISKKIDTLNDKLDVYRRKISEAEQQTNQSVSNMGTIFKQYLLNGAVNILNRVISAFVQLGRSATKSIGKMFGVFSKTVSSAIGLQQAIRLIVQYGFGFRSLYYLVRRLRSGIEAGFEYLGGAVKSSRRAVSGFSEEVGKLLDTLKELVYYLKSAAAAMLQPFMPLLNSIIPKLVSWFNALAIAVANFIATLTGQSKIYVASTNLEDYANALDKVTGSANEAREALGAYDKLNVIHEDKNKGGGGATLDTSGWFSEQDVEPSDLAKKIKEAWEKADFTEVGQIIGRRFQEMLNNIDWDGAVFPMIEKVAKSIATFINGFISVDGLGADIGEAIGNVFNTVTLYVDTFSKTVSWEGVGQFIVDGINKFLETFDAAQLGSSLHAFVDGFLTVLGQVFEDIDSTQLGEDIGTFFQNLQFKDLATKLITVAKKFAISFAEALSTWAQTDPESFGIAKALLIASALTKLTGLAIPFVLQLGQSGAIDLSGVFDTIKLFFTTTLPQWFTQTVIPKLTTFFTGGFKTVFTNALNGLVTFLSTPIGAIVALLGAGLIGEIANSWDENLSPLENILTGLGNAWSNLYDNVIAPIADAIGSLIIPIWESLKETFSNIVEAIGTALIPICQDIATALSTVVFPAIKTVFDLVKDVFDFLTPIITTVIKIIGDILTVVVDVVGGIIKVVSPFIQFIIECIGGIISVIDSVIEIVGEMLTHWNDAWEGVKETVKSVANSVIDFINKILSAVQSMVNNMIDGINSLLSFKLPAWASKLTGIQSVNVNMPHVNIPQIPKLAQGAVIPPNREFLAMLGDQSSGTNIEAPLDTIKQALIEALGDSANTSPIVLQLDGKTIAKAVWDENEKRYKQLGKYAY